MKFDFTKEPGKILKKRSLITNENPLVSIVTPYYNASKYFEQTYNCVMNQTFPWFEWIIVDDGSTDLESVKLLEDIVLQDNRIKIVHQRNRGPASARNRGIGESCTEIIVPLDADDLIEPTFLELLYWALYFNPDCSWAYVDSCGFQNQEYVWQKEFNAELMKHENYLVATAAIRKKDILEVNGYEESVYHFHEDWGLWLKLLGKSKKPIRVNSIEFWYRRTDTSRLIATNSVNSVEKAGEELIQKLALDVDNTVCGKIFEEYNYNDRFTLPIRSKFEKEYISTDNKTEILFIIPWMITGGADQFNLDFIRLLNKDKYEITIVCTVSSENGWKQRFREYTSSVFCLPEFLDVRNYAEFISYIINTRKIDVCLISNSYYGYYLAPWLRKEYPQLALIDYVHMEEWYWRAGGYGRTSMAMSDVIEKTYVCNNATKKVFYEAFKRQENSVQTIHIGVDYEKYNPEYCKKGAIKKQLGLNNNERIVLFPCRLHAQKRPYLMIEIAQKVIELNKDVRFLVVGDGPEREGIKNRINEYQLSKYIIMVGEQADMRSYYNDSDITLVCSLMEGLSLTAYESCSMMTPVVTADVGGQTDLIDESVGRVIPCMQLKEDILSDNFNSEEINLYAQAIQELLLSDNEEEYNRLCENCRNKIIESFGLDTMIRDMEHAIEECFYEERKEKRQNIAEALKHFSYLVEDQLSIFTTLESMEKECGNIWNSKVQLEQDKNKQFEEMSRQLEDKHNRMNYFENEFNRVNNSISLKIGLGLTWIFRKLRSFIKHVR